MTDLIMKIGARIRLLRRDRKFSQEELAERAGLHTNYVGQIERGEKNVTLETLGKIAVALDLSLEELFRYINPMEGKDAFNEIIDLLLERPESDHEMVLNLLKTIFQWKENKQ